MNLSIVILTKNNDKTIENTLKTAIFADEILVIDDFSTDNTLIISVSPIYRHSVRNSDERS